MRHILSLSWHLLLVATLVIWSAASALAAFTDYDTETWDFLNLGVPKFVNVVYLDLAKISAISKFRSNAGHEYSDSTQFSTSAYSEVGQQIEFCRSMKHYFAGPEVAGVEPSVQIYAPTNGIVSRMFDELIGGTQVQITSSDQPAFTFIIFHVTLATPLKEGDGVTAGQLLGHHVGTQTQSDIAVQVHTPRGYHHVSYFEVMTDHAFAAFQARGITSREQLIYTREQRDAARFTCSGTRFNGDPNLANADYVKLTGGATSQTITAKFTPIGNPQVGAAPTPISATSSSGLPVTIVSQSPKLCAIDGASVTWRRPGLCTIVMRQEGNANTFAALGLQTTYPTFPG